MRLFTTTILLTIALGVSAQGMRKKLADDYYNALAYESAAPLYKDLGAQTIKGKNQNWEVVRRGALCYMLSHNYQQSAKLYGELFKAGNSTAEDNHNYAEVLRTLGRYEDAKTVIQAIFTANPNDGWAKEYIQDAQYFTELKLDSATFKIKKVPFSKGF